MHDLGTISHTQAAVARADLLLAADHGADSGILGNMLHHHDAVLIASCGACALQIAANAAPRPDLVPPEVLTTGLDGCGALVRRHGRKFSSRKCSTRPCRRQHCSGRAQGSALGFSRRSPGRARCAASGRPSRNSTLRRAAVRARDAAQPAGAERHGRAFSCSAGVVAHPAWASLLGRNTSRAALAAPEGALVRIWLWNVPASLRF